MKTTRSPTRRRGVIASQMYAAKYGVRCDVLVRATGGTGKLDWDVYGGRTANGTTPTLVVDVFDTAGDVECRNAEVRRREYKEQGLVVLTEPVKTRTVKPGTVKSKT